MRQYIVLLWLQARDAETVERFRREICLGCGAEALMWPTHVSLFYGITVEDREPLLRALRGLARETRSFPLDIEGIGSFGQSVAYLRIRFSEEMMRLQTKIREIVERTCDVQCDYAQLKKPDGTPLSAAEVKNMREWGSYYPFAPHITLAQHLLPGQMEQLQALGARLLAGLPGRMVADHMSLAVFETGSPVSETVEAMSFAGEETGDRESPG